ncbi:unnamed protein product [Prunus armeniaca]
MDVIKPMDREFSDIPQAILGDSRYMPHFKDCIGAIDGVHVQASYHLKIKYFILVGKGCQLKTLWLYVTLTCNLYLHVPGGRALHMIQECFFRFYAMKI